MSSDAKKAAWTRLTGAAQDQTNAPSEATAQRLSSAAKAWATASDVSTSRPPTSGGGNGLLLPNYGRSKGLPVVGASLQDLEFYANGARRSLSDPSKARWHDKEKELLAALEAEIARQSGHSAPPTDDNIPPPPGDEDAPF